MLEYDVDVNQHVEYGKITTNILCFAIEKLNIDGIKLFLDCKGKQIDFTFGEKTRNPQKTYSISEWINEKNKNKFISNKKKQQVLKLLSNYRVQLYIND